MLLEELLPPASRSTKIETAARCSPGLGDAIDHILSKDAEHVPVARSRQPEAEPDRVGTGWGLLLALHHEAGRRGKLPHARRAAGLMWMQTTGTSEGLSSPA